LCVLDENCDFVGSREAQEGKFANSSIDANEFFI